MYPGGAGCAQPWVNAQCQMKRQKAIAGCMMDVHPGYVTYGERSVGDDIHKTLGLKQGFTQCRVMHCCRISALKLFDVYMHDVIRSCYIAGMRVSPG
jgi:hypothetical protein